jgi:type IV secretory pathway VirB4 component
MNSFYSVLDRAQKLGPGCQWFEETVGAYPVFLGILPLAPTFVTRPKRLLTSHLSDLLPVYGSGPGHEAAEILFETPQQSLFGFSLFEKSPSANAILIGSTGSGKSTLACGIILGMSAGNRGDAPSSFVIDVGNSFKRTIQYLGGSSLDLSPENGTVVNPFDLRPGETEPDPEKVKFLTALFEEILGEQGKLGKLEKALLETEILAFYKQPGPKRLSTFKSHLESCKQAELRQLSKLIALWCKPHPFGLLFDGDTNVELTAPHLHFELKGCQRYPDLLRVAMLVVIDSIWREVKGRFPGRSLVVIDECHTIIRSSGDGRSNSAARWVEDCFRQMRKFSSAAIAISQTARDLKNDEIGDGILANAPNRFILRQRGDEKALREDLKLNEREARAVFSLSQVRGSFSEFFLQSESFKGVLLYRPTPLDLWLSTTHPPDIELLNREAAGNPGYDLVALMDHMATRFPNGAEGGPTHDDAA